MLEALYNLTVLAETGAFSYLFGKYTLDFLWESFVYLAVKYDLMDNEHVSALIDGFKKVGQ